MEKSYINLTRVLLSPKIFRISKLSLVISQGATIMIWRGRTITLQIIGRILQGFSSTIIWVTGLAMIADTVDPNEFGEYISYLSIAMMIGT